MKPNVGDRVKTTVDFFGIPPGTTGTVIKVDDIGYVVRMDNGSISFLDEQRSGMFEQVQQN